MNRRTLFTASLAMSLVALLVPGTSSAGLLDAASQRWRTIPTGPAPSWATPELHRQVVAAGPQGVALPSEAEADIPASSLAFLGIRPGGLMLLWSDGGSTLSLCTANFVFRNPSTGQYAIGTAGHCGNVGDDVDMVALPFGLVNIGRVIFSTGDAGVGDDFALVSIAPSLNPWVSPSMAHWGGPTGVYTGSGPAPIVHSGWGLVIGTGGTPRAGLGMEWTSDEWRFIGAIVFGDSGSAANVTPSGLAAGNITHISVDLGSLSNSAGTSITKILQYAGSYQLQTCGLAIPWPLPGCP
jgi:hypothetical protein